jgi:hypothetical protein
MLVSEDTSVIGACQGVVNSLPGLRLLAIDRMQEADCYLAQDQLSLILYHFAHAQHPRNKQPCNEDKPTQTQYNNI